MSDKNKKKLGELFREERNRQDKQFKKQKEKIVNTKVKLSSDITKPVQLGLSPISWMRKYMGVK